MDRRLGWTTRCVTALAVAILGVGGASAKLIDNGQGLIYDTVLNITWTQDANLCVTLANCVNGTPFGMAWDDGSAWARTLVFDGVAGWRLPYASVTAGIGPADLIFGQACTGRGDVDEKACRDDEMAYMFYYNFGGAYFANPVTGTQTADGVTFNNIQSVYYSGTLLVPGDVWSFDFYNGFQSFVGDGTFGARFPVWAVHDGNVSAAPEPSALLLIVIASLASFTITRKPVGAGRVT